MLAVSAECLSDPARVEVTLTGKAAGTANYTIRAAEGDAQQTGQITVHDRAAEQAAAAAEAKAKAERQPLRRLRKNRQPPKPQQLSKQRRNRPPPSRARLFTLRPAASAGTAPQAVPARMPAQSRWIKWVTARPAKSAHLRKQYSRPLPWGLLYFQAFNRTNVLFRRCLQWQPLENVEIVSDPRLLRI